MDANHGATQMSGRFAGPEDPHLPTSEEIRRIVESRKGSGFASMLWPLSLDIDRDLLEQLVRQSLERLQAGSGWALAPEDDEDQHGAPPETRLQQHIDFLAWLQREPETVAIALYPAAHDGLDEVAELMELGPDDEEEWEDGELPF